MVHIRDFELVILKGHTIDQAIYLTSGKDSNMKAHFTLLALWTAEVL